jgi:hypothetical protein
MKRWVVGAIIAALVATVIPQARGQELQYVGSAFWIGTYDVELVGQYAYCADMNGLIIYDVSDPANPIRVSQTFAPGENMKIAVSGDYVCLADFGEGLRIIDASDMVHPAVVSLYPVAHGISDVFVAGNYAFISSNNLYDSTLFRIIDISTPANPVLVGRGLIPYDIGTSIHVAGNYVYLGTLGGTLHLYDISDISNPALVSSIIVEPPDAHTNGLQTISLTGNYAYIIATQGFYVVDIADPINPAIIVQNRHDAYRDMDINGNRAFAVGGDCIAVFDISDPINPVMTSRLNIRTPHLIGISASGPIACLAASEYFQTYDVSNPDTTILIGSVGDTYLGYDDIAVSGNYIYTPHNDPYVGSFRVIDISDRSHPVFIDSCENLYGSRNVFVSGGYAYTTRSDSGMGIINIADPHNPFLAGSYMQQSSSSSDVYVQGNYAYLSTALDLEILNVSDPPHPVLVGQFWRLGSVTVHGSYAYLNESSSGTLWVINIADPANPVAVGSLPIIFSGAPFVLENYAYLRQNQGISIVDISNPAAPVFVSSCSTRVYSSEISVSGSYLYAAITDIAEGEGGVDVIDISDPANPVLVSRYVLPGHSRHICVDDNYCYLAGEYSLIILTTLSTGTEDGGIKPQAFSLPQNYPNPFNARTTIRYTLSQAGKVRLEIFNIIGERVAVIIDEIEQAGPHNIIWDAAGVPSGVYFAKLDTGGKSHSIKMVVLK